jgi:hypothetical protein
MIRIHSTIFWGKLHFLNFSQKTSVLKKLMGLCHELNRGQKLEVLMFLNYHKGINPVAQKS